MIANDGSKSVGAIVLLRVGTSLMICAFLLSLFTAALVGAAPSRQEISDAATEYCKKYDTSGGDWEDVTGCRSGFKDSTACAAMAGQPYEAACRDGASSGTQFVASQSGSGGQNPGQNGQTGQSGQSNTNGAGQCGNARFLSFPTWWRGLTLSSDCSLELDGMAPEKLFSIIAANIAEIIIQLVGYASVVFIIIGGFKYMISTGDPSGMAGARKTILNAVIGLLLSILSVGIVNIVFSRL